MSLARWIRHWLRLPRSVDRALPPAALDRLEQAIADSERRHRGEIRLAVESALPWSYLRRDASVRERAEMMFAKMRLWDTDERNGVLIYVELADHGVEIVADRGVAQGLPTQAWAPIVAAMVERFRRGEFEAGLAAGIAQVGEVLAERFPARAGEPGRNELPDRPLLQR